MVVEALNCSFADRLASYLRLLLLEPEATATGLHYVQTVFGSLSKNCAAWTRAIARAPQLALGLEGPARVLLW